MKKGGFPEQWTRQYAGLLARPLIIFSRHPVEDGKIIPLHRRNTIFVRSGTQTEEDGAASRLY